MECLKCKTPLVLAGEARDGPDKPVVVVYYYCPTCQQLYHKKLDGPLTKILYHDSNNHTEQSLQDYRDA